jgi:hypothetical protein
MTNLLMKRREFIKIGLSAAALPAIPSYAGTSALVSSMGGDTVKLGDVHGHLVVTICSKGQFSPPTDVIGMKLLAAVAHKHGFPVTWILKPFSVRDAADDLRAWHEAYGDEVAWFTEETPLNKAEAEFKEMQMLTPWQKSGIVSAGTVKYGPEWVAVYQTLGIQSVWGRCYEQTDADEICDRGSPHGFYYLWPQNYKVPNPDMGGVISVPWLSNDPNLIFWTGFQSSFTFDPDDPMSLGFLGEGRCEFWFALADQFQRQTQYNRFVPLIVQQEYPTRDHAPNTLEQTLEPMDELFAYLKKKGVTAKCQSDSVAEYKAVTNGKTPPTYGVYDNLGSLDIIRHPLKSALFSFQAVDAPLKKASLGAPFNGYYTTSDANGIRLYYSPDGKKYYQHGKMFVYYDTNGLLLFDENQSKPLRITTYLEVPPGKQGYDPLPELSFFYNTAQFIPEVKVRQVKVTGGLKIHVSVAAFQANIVAKKRLPYGVMLWGDYREYRILDNMPEGSAIVGDQGLFIPMILNVALPVEAEYTLKQ